MDLFATSESEIRRSALFSDDGRHRLALRRSFGVGRSSLFIGVNPSKANADFDDLTVQKLYGFGARLGIGHWTLANKFTYVATDVSELAEVEGPNHESANSILRQEIGKADLLIVAWGTLGKLPPRLRHRWREVIAMMGSKPAFCWGTCLDGHPRHPGRIGYDTELVPWVVP